MKSSLQSIYSIITLMLVVMGIPATAGTPGAAIGILDSISLRIKQIAHDDAVKDVDLRTEFAIDRALSIATDIDQIEAGRIYDEEYFRVKDSLKATWPVRLHLKDIPSPWYIAAIIGVVFLLGMCLKDALVKGTTALFSALGNRIYNLCAGSRLFRGVALTRYRKKIYDNFNTLKLSFRPNQPLPMREVYVPLRVADNLQEKTIEALQALSLNRRLMIKGQPGSGKTVLLKWLMLSYTEGRLGLSDYPIPILVELNRLNRIPDITAESVEKELVASLARFGFPKADRFVGNGLKRGSVMLLFDGLDEVNAENRNGIVLAIKDLLKTYDKCRALITCRSAVYKDEFVECVDRTLEVAEFSDRDIRRFLTALKFDRQSGKSAEQLLQTLHERPAIFSLARNPLMLTIIAYLYEDPQFVIPHSRATFYKKATDQLLGKRDVEKQVYNNYNENEKKLVLQHLALCFQQQEKDKTDRRSVDHATVLALIKELLPSLGRNPESDALPILNEIIDRSGLLMRIDNGERYQFTHLTLQEYFCAAGLVGKADVAIERFTAKPDEWLEIIKLWCGLSSDPTEMIRKIYAIDPIVALEALADAPKVEEATYREIVDNAEQSVLSNKEAYLKGLVRVANALGTIAAAGNIHGKMLLKTLMDRFAIVSDSTPFAGIDRFMFYATCLAATNMHESAHLITTAFFNDKNPGLALFAVHALQRMGDIAVDPCKDAAEKGVFHACETLGSIATPSAAVTLTNLLWHDNTEIATVAALELSKLLTQPEIEEELNGYEISEKWKHGDIETWVWEPFSQSKNSSLPIIVGKIVSILKNIDIGRYDGVRIDKWKKIDPRIAIPFCAIEARHMVGERIETINTGEYKDLLQEDFLESEKTHIVRLKIVHDILEKIDPQRVWRLAFSSLGLREQVKLLEHLLLDRIAVPKDWKSVLKKLSYTFTSNLHFYIPMVCSVLFSVIALAGIGCTAWTQRGTLTGGLVCIGIAIIGSFWSTFIFGMKRQFDPDILEKMGFLGWAYYFKYQVYLFKGIIPFP